MSKSGALASELKVHSESQKQQQQAAANAEGGGQRKKKVTAAQLRVQKGQLSQKWRNSYEMVALTEKVGQICQSFP